GRIAVERREACALHVLERRVRRGHHGRRGSCECGRCDERSGGRDCCACTPASATRTVLGTDHWGKPSRERCEPAVIVPALTYGAVEQKSQASCANSHNGR